MEKKVFMVAIVELDSEGGKENIINYLSNILLTEDEQESYGFTGISSEKSQLKSFAIGFECDQDAKDIGIIESNGFVTGIPERYKSESLGYYLVPVNRNRVRKVVSKQESEEALEIFRAHN
jgi:hypothetical protein